MRPLEGKVAVVAGASRGAGRGIALALGEAGATVYVAGRTVRGGPRPPDGAPGTVEDTAEEISARGGVGVAVRADCTAGDDVAALFERVDRERGRVDVLANAVWGAADAFPSTDEWMAVWNLPFWEQPVRQWQAMVNAGPYAYFLTAVYAARRMAAAGGGLIAAVTDGVVGEVPADQPGGQLVWDLSHHCINRLVAGMAAEGKSKKIAAVTLMPGFMRTERVMMHMKTEKLKKMFRFDKSETPEYLGRAVAALAADPDVLKKTGKVHFVADLAREYGFTDADGRQVPRFHPAG